MKEDDVTDLLIEFHKGLEDSEVNSVEKVEVEPEAHYNHYGTRGVADLHVRKKKLKTVKPLSEEKVYEKKDILIEVKSRLDNANEVIRQFNKMKNYFYRDKERTKPSSVTYELQILPTEHNFRHVLQNKNIYQSLINDQTRIMFRHPDEITPVVLSQRFIDEDYKSFKQVCEYSNEKIFQIFKPVLDELIEGEE